MVDRLQPEEIPNSECQALQKLNARVLEVGSHLCVGLDIHPTETEFNVVDWIPYKNFNIIAQTHLYAAAYKIQLSGYLASGSRGISDLEYTTRHLKQVYPQIPVILDAKFNDIGISLEQYAHFAFEHLGVDAVTANPLLGLQENMALIKHTDKLIYFLCSTSNPSAHEFQQFQGLEDSLNIQIAKRVQAFNNFGNCGLVVGATHPEIISDIRRAAPDLPFLMPGLGAQGASADLFIPPALTQMPASVIVNVSRGITQAQDPIESSADFVTQIDKASGVKYSPEHQMQHVLKILQQANCIQYGDFILKSGEKSSVYINIRNLSVRPDLLLEIAKSMAIKTQNLEYDVIATIPQGGMPLATSFSLLTQKPMCWVRLEQKKYGTGEQIDGGMDLQGKRVLLVDDVITHAVSKIMALKILQDAGAEVCDLAVVVDRRDEKSHGLEGISIHSLITLDQLLTK